MGAGLFAGAKVLGPRNRAAAGPSSRSTSATPKRGGVLRVGMTSGGADDTIDPLVWPTNMDGLRVFQLYDSLTALDKQAQPQLALAEEFTPNANATEWTVRLREGVTFHDGKPLTIDDVIYTYKLVANPKNPLTGFVLLGPVDVANIKKLDSRTMRVPCHSPYESFFASQACYQFFIIPEGSNPETVRVGTGPFKFESFTPGEQSTFTRNDNYWQTGLPYVDKVVISDYADDTSQVNGLISGQLDLIGALLGDDIPAIKTGGCDVLVENGGAYGPFTMRVDQPPFDDIRVRQAMRLVVDRPEMLDLVFGGYGLIGNDLFAPFDPSYDHALPQRHADIEQAKFLLKQAGHEHLTVTLVTSDIGAGSIKAAQVFAEQASAAGVTVNLQQVPVSTLYGPNYLKWTFAQDVWTYYPYLPNAQETFIKGAVFNECHVNNAKYTRLFNEANATVNDGLRTELIHEMQTLEYNGEASGYIVPYFIPSIDGFTKHVHGLTPSDTSNPLGGFDLSNVWMD